MSVYVIDEVMGRGKTTAMIHYINQSDQEQRYLYITPYLTEVDRIKEACEGREFVEPMEYGGKLKSIKRLLADRENIVSTHALFAMFDSEVLELVRNGNYILVMDEAATVFEPIALGECDVDLLLKYDMLKVGDRNRLIWTAENYHGTFDSVRRRVSCGNVYYCDKTMWIQMMDPDLFTAFKDVYLMTYMFQDQLQRCYFDFVKIPYSRKYVVGQKYEELSIGDSEDPVPPIDYKSLIRLNEDAKLNAVGDGTRALSKGWYEHHKSEDSLKQLRNATYNFFQNKVKAKSSDLIWTTFRGDDDNECKWQRLVSGKGYATGFLSCNARGTNEYRDRTAMAYLVNRFPNPLEHAFLKQNGIALNEGNFALSEMLQWLWRSAIRDGKPIDVFVPSSRMRALLKKWIAENSPA